jgi:hypothetical protein
MTSSESTPPTLASEEAANQKTPRLLPPTITVGRLVVFKDNRIVLETVFHKGLNIVSGHNSSGKTTTLDFLAHTIGAEDIPWKKEALLCDYAMVELLLNNVPVTLRRDVGEAQMKPIYIFWGPFAEARKASVDAWELYPFRRSSQRLSFTQSLLLALGMPEVQGDGASNLTMHQFLRVMYADQPSLHSPIFRIDSFDNALTRATVGDYLLGVYDDKLYSAQLSKRDFERALSAAESELKSIFTVLAKSQQDVNIEFFGQQIIEAEKRLSMLGTDLAQLKENRTIDRDKKRSNEETVSRSALDAAKRNLNKAVDELARIDADIEDSKQFINEIKERLKRLDQSEATRGYLGKIAFNFCPCCLSPVVNQETEIPTCTLCKTPFETPNGESQILRMRNELLVQQKESEALIRGKESAIESIRLSIPALRQNMRQLERRYTEATQNWTSGLELAIEKIIREIGAVEQEIKTLYENQRLASVIRSLQERRDDLQQQITEINTTIESLAHSQEIRKRDVALAISQATSRLLKLDLYRQEEFRTADVVRFGFEENQVSVDGSTRFSESSTVVLRHLFHLALMTVSTKIPEMRFPRFLMLDGIEDGGIEMPRAHRLQEIVAAECESYEVDFQVIMATSQIAPSLDSDRFVVGRRYTEDHRAIDFKPSEKAPSTVNIQQSQ